jgi:hypothetical protein
MTKRKRKQERPTLADRVAREARRAGLLLLQEGPRWEFLRCSEGTAKKVIRQLLACGELRVAKLARRAKRLATEYVYTGPVMCVGQKGGASAAAARRGEELTHDQRRPAAVLDPRGRPFWQP